MKIKVDENNVRIDIYLAKKLDKSRTKISSLIRDNCIYVNNKVVLKGGLLVFQDDIIEIKEIKHDPNQENKNNLKLEPFNFDLKILYEDEFLIIVYKPSGMLSHPTKFNENNTLMNALQHYFNNSTNFYLVHRIDKDTSGLVLIAKNEKILLDLQKLFENHEIVKKYYALVHNQLHKDHILIDIPIGRSRQNKLKMISSSNSKNAKQAISEVYLVKNFHHHSLLEVIIKTGRTHQIRVHLKYINHPIVNDPLYGIEKNCSKYGQYLMAYYISFIHPVTKKIIEQKIELDKEFKDIIKQMEKD